MEKKRLFALVLIFHLSVTICSTGLAAEKNQFIFSTWKGFEVDKCASIWLLKKIFNQRVTIKFYPKTAEIKEGILFDTPEAKFRRYFNMSTYESFAKHYKIIDPKLLYIGKIIHDIEVNTWEKKVLKETTSVRDAINKIIWETDDEMKVIEKTCRYFDAFYNDL